MSKSQPPISSNALLEIMSALEQGAFDCVRGTVHECPAWAWAIEREDIKAIEVAIDRSQIIHGHDHLGRSFLVACLDEELPMGIVLLGLSKSSDQWWMPGPDGRDVFSHPALDVSMANTIGQRLWAHGLWQRVRGYFGAWPGRPARTRAMRMLSSWMPESG